MSGFEKINNREIELPADFTELKYNLQISVHDLYFQGLLKQTEMLVLLKSIAEAKNIDELRGVEKEFWDTDAFFVHREGKIADEFAEIKNLKILFDKTSGDINPSNWEKKFIYLLEEVSRMHVQEYHKILIKSWLAGFLEQTYRGHSEKKIDLRILGDRLRTVLTELEPNLPGFLKTGGEADQGKRKPSFIESVDGTMERFYKIEELREIFKDLADGMIVGGSMSYGPFFNIRKSLDETGGSDIDLIIILPENKFDTSLWKKMRDSDIFSNEEKDIFFDRMKKFPDLYKNEEADVFSQKFHVQKTDFEVSIHFFTPSIFDKMLGDDFQNDLSAGTDKVSVIKDYRPKKFPHKICPQQNFLGEQYEYNVPPQRQTDGGTITDLPGYIIQNNSFYPGIYQNLISPRFSVLYDRTGDTTKRVEGFRSAMEKRLIKERADRPEAQLLKSHIRHKIFSPELLKKF